MTEGVRPPSGHRIDGIPQRLLVELLPKGTVPTLEWVELRYIEMVLDYTGGNKQYAAELLGIDRRTLYRKLAGDRDSPEAQIVAEARRRGIFPGAGGGEGRKYLGGGRYEED